MRPDYDRAATLAALTLLKLGVDSTPVYPERLIRQCKNTRLMTYAEYCMLPGVIDRFPDAITYPHPEALTHVFEWNGETSWLVYYDPQMLKGDRWKFSLAHELGHIVMHHTGRSDTEEAEADFFAAHLLLPRAIIAELIARDIPLLEINLYNLSNASHACLWTMQQSEPAFVAPEYNAALRQRFMPYVEHVLSAGLFWATAMHPMALYSLTSYMKGYKE